MAGAPVLAESSARRVHRLAPQEGACTSVVSAGDQHRGQRDEGEHEREYDAPGGVGSHGCYLRARTCAWPRCRRAPASPVLYRRLPAAGTRRAKTAPANGNRPPLKWADTPIRGSASRFDRATGGCNPRERSVQGQADAADADLCLQWLPSLPREKTPVIAELL